MTSFTMPSIPSSRPIPPPARLQARQSRPPAIRSITRSASTWPSTGHSFTTTTERLAASGEIYKIDPSTGAVIDLIFPAATV